MVANNVDRKRPLRVGFQRVTREFTIALCSVTITHKQQRAGMIYGKVDSGSFHQLVVNPYCRRMYRENRSGTIAPGAERRRRSQASVSAERDKRQRRALKILNKGNAHRASIRSYHEWREAFFLRRSGDRDRN